jgi:sec-independent protein translocase protein TatA
MHMPSLMGLLIVLGLAFLLFGRPGRISHMMEDLGKGIRGFRKGLSDSDTPESVEKKPEPPPAQITDARARDDQRTSA